MLTNPHVSCPCPNAVLRKEELVREIMQASATDDADPDVIQKLQDELEEMDTRIENLRKVCVVHTSCGIHTSAAYWSYSTTVHAAHKLVTSLHA